MEMREQQERKCSNRTVIYKMVTESTMLINPTLLVMLGTVCEHTKTLETELRYII
jgi:hypothetical protein